MKTVLLIRHAKSDWDSAFQTDRERKLNERGKRDAPDMAKRLLKKGVQIDRFISSTAVRAYDTCVLFAKEYDVKEKMIQQQASLYEAPAEAYELVISAADDDDDCIAIFGHNPGITYYVNTLTTTRIDNMPTCSVFAVKAHTRHWKDFADAKKEWWFFDYPKSVK